MNFYVIQNFYKYSISEEGVIINNRTGYIKKITFDKDGYPIVNLQRNNNETKYSSKSTPVHIHRVLAQLFIPNPENKPCVNHKDGNKTNNKLENLEWCTYRENTIHSIYVLNNKTKHSEETKTKIRQSNKKNKRINAKPLINTITNEVFQTIGDAAKSHGITKSCLSAMILGQNPNKTPFVRL